MAISRAERTRLRNARTTARRNLISRTARIWTKGYRDLTASLKETAQDWLNKLQQQARKDIASGYIDNPPELPEKFTQTLQEKLRWSMAQGYWLNYLYVQELKAAYSGRKYRGKVTLSEIPEDERIKELLRDFIELDASEEWYEIIPIEAVNWLNDYVPKLAGIFSASVLEKTREVIQKSMLEGSTLQERMKALRESSEELARMTNQRIEAIARTEITRADSMGRLIQMKVNDDVIGVEFSAVMDDRTTEMCIERNGLMMRLDDPRLPENTPPLHINCVLGDTLVLPIGRVSALSERVFNGDIFIIESAGGNNLAGTPNHPILTSHGWIPLCEIKEGDYIVCNALRERGNVINGENQQVVTCIKNAASAFFDNREVRATPVPMTAKDFHHDGGQSEVAIIYADRKLLDGMKSSINKQVVKHGFVWRNVIRSFFENCERMFFFFRNRFFSASDSFMSFLCKFHTFFRCRVLHSYKLLFMSIAWFYSMFNKNASDCIRCCNVESDSNTANTYTLIMQSDDSFMVNGIDGSFPLNTAFEQNIIHLIESDSVFFAKFTEGEAREIIFDKVVSVKSDRFNGHVYNLQTESGIFVANNIITHNCRSLLLSLTVYDFPDGVLTSHEFDEVTAGNQRPEDIEMVRALLEGIDNPVEEIASQVELIHGVEKTQIDSLRGVRGHKEKYSLTVDDVKQDYERVGIDITEEYAKEVHSSLYDFTSADYKYMRDAFLKDKRGEMLSDEEKKYLARYQLCAEYTKIAPTYEGIGGEIYRGIANPNSEYTQSLFNLKVGDTFDLEMPSSFSTERQTARGFSGSDGVIIHIMDTDLVNAPSISGLSECREESEVLVNDLLFEVVKVDDQRIKPGVSLLMQSGDGRYHITLKRKV